MKTGIQKIVIASVMLLAQTFSMHAASNAQNVKNEAANLVAALLNWRTDHPNSIFMSHTTKGSTRSKNILDGDNFIIMKAIKDAKTGAVTQHPKLVWADTLQRADQFIQANAANNQTIQTALNACLGTNNMILKILMQANKLKDNDKAGKIMLMSSSSPILNTKTSVPSAESALATLKKAANTLSPSWFGKIKDSEKTKAAKEVTLALIHVLEDALNHITSDFQKFKAEAPATRPALLGAPPAHAGSAIPKAPAMTPAQREKEFTNKKAMIAHEEAAFARDLAAFKKGDTSMTYQTLLANWGPGSEPLKTNDADLNDRKKRFEMYNTHIKAAVQERYAKIRPETAQSKADAKRRIDEQNRIQQESDKQEAIKNVVKQI